MLASTIRLLIVRTIHKTWQNTAHGKRLGQSSFAVAVAAPKTPRHAGPLSRLSLQCVQNSGRMHAWLRAPAPQPSQSDSPHVPPILPRKTHRRLVPPRPAAGRGAIWSHERSIMMRRQAHPPPCLPGRNSLSARAGAKGAPRMLPRDTACRPRHFPCPQPRLCRGLGLPFCCRGLIQGGRAGHHHSHGLTSFVAYGGGMRPASCLLPHRTPHDGEGGAGTGVLDPQASPARVGCVARRF